MGGSYIPASDNGDGSFSCDTGIAATLSPDTSAVTLLNTIKDDLKGEGYKQKILQDFLWANKYSSLSNEPKSSVKASTRGEQWNQQLHSALTPETRACDFSVLKIDIMDSRLLVKNVCSLH